VDVKFLLSRMLGIGFTSDGFTSDANLHFHSLTSHGVLIFRGRFLFLSFMLADDVFSEGDAVTESVWILQQLDHWGIDEARRAGLTIDGAMRATARATGMPYLWCPAHWLQLGIHDVTEWPKVVAGKVPEKRLNEYPKFQRHVWEIIDKAKRSVSLFSSPKNWAELVAIHERLKIKELLKSLKQDQATRWSSEFTMLEAVMESQREQEEWYRVHFQRERIMQPIDFKICSEMIFVLSAPKHVTLRRQKWEFPNGLDVWPDFFRCIEYWLTECTDAVITTALVREFRDGLIVSVVERAALFLRESEKLNLAMMAMSSYFWNSQGGTWRIAALWDRYPTVFQKLIFGVTGVQFVDRVFGNFVGCVELRAPSTLAACCGGLYVDAPKASELPDGEVIGALPLHKKSKTAIDRLFGGVLEDVPSDFKEDIRSEARKFIHLLGPLGTQDILAACQTLLLRKECPRCVHVVVYHMGVCGSNAPSESTFSDTNFVTSDRRGRTGADWAEAQVKVHRNYDVVKKLRALAGAKPGQPLAEVWDEKKGDWEG
jgi:hypothetical protein